MVASTSVDGWITGTPLTALTDGRDAPPAVGMNGDPLPLEHSYPVRMVVPGLYGYVSAVKWVVSLEATRFDRAQPYWTSSTSAAALRNRPPPPDLRSPPLTDQVKCPRRSPSAHP